jgi:hypothetical protein
VVDFAELKKFFLFNLIGSLIVCALVAVVTVLIGTFNEVTTKVLTTLFMVVAHSLFSLAFIWDNERQRTFERLALFINTLFILIVLSFLTSIFGVWDILSGKIVWHLYESYFVIGFAALHADILLKARGKEDYIDKIIYANYVFMSIVAVMLLFLIHTAAEPGDFFYRLLGASAIVDGTLSILTIIFYKLYMQKYPEAVNTLGGGSAAKPAKKGLSVWVWILLAYIFVQLIAVLRFFI